MTEAGVFGGVAIQGERPMRNVFVVDEQVELLFWVFQSHHFLLKRVQIRRALDDENANNDCRVFISLCVLRFNKSIEYLHWQFSCHIVTLTRRIVVNLDRSIILDQFYVYVVEYKTPCSMANVKLEVTIMEGITN